MKINLGLSGANGRMGKAIINALRDNSSFDLKLKLTKETEPNTLIENLKKIDILIDFSTPVSCIEYLKICSDFKIPVVIGTTGFNQNQQAEIIKFAEYIPILISPNMSIGVNVCKYLIKILSKAWSECHKKFTHITINEIHHKNKKDAPSGTALMFAELIKQNYLNLENNIEFNSKRIGTVKGKHQVIFANDLEELSIIHKVKDRKIFATGSLLAAKWLFDNKLHLAPKLYNFSDVLNIINL